MTRKYVYSLIIAFVSFSSLYGCDQFSPKAKSPVKQENQHAAVNAAAASETGTPAVAKTDQKLPKDVVAKVGDWTLTAAELEERIKNIKVALPNFDEKNIEAKKMLVDELIRQQLMVREAREQKLDQGKDVRDAVKDFENNVLVQQLVSGITKDIKVTDEEARQYYEKNPDLFVNPVEKKVLEIVTNAEAEAKDVLVQALQGGDFSQLAKDRSKGKTAANGGDLGFLAPDAVPFEQMKKVIEPLVKGSVSSVFQGPDGYYVVKIDDVRGGDKLTYDKVKDDLVKGLTGQKQQQAVLERLSEIAKKTKVSVNNEVFGGKAGE